MYGNTAETGIRADTADDLGPVLLGRLYPVMDLLKSEQIEYQMALNKELHPYLLVTIKQSWSGAADGNSLHCG